MVGQPCQDGVHSWGIFCFQAKSCPSEISKGDKHRRLDRLPVSWYWFHLGFEVLIGLWFYRWCSKFTWIKSDPIPICWLRKCLNLVAIRGCCQNQSFWSKYGDALHLLVSFFSHFLVRSNAGFSFLPQLFLNAWILFMVFWGVRHYSREKTLGPAKPLWFIKGQGFLMEPNMYYKVC